MQSSIFQWQSRSCIGWWRSRFRWADSSAKFLCTPHSLEKVCKHTYTETDGVPSCVFLSSLRLRQWWDTHPVVPGTKFSVVWDLLLATVVILICLVYSFEAGFSLYHRNVAYCSGAAGTILFAFTYLLDLVLVIDIVVSMKTAVRTPTGIGLIMSLCSYNTFPSILEI